MRITEAAAEEIILHARTEFPRECCGLLAGKNRIIGCVRRCRNIRDSGSAFEIAAEELFDFFRSIRIAGKEFLGIYHSHPKTAAQPSSRDREEFFYFDASYWIVSLTASKPVLQCFKWEGGGFSEIKYEIVRPSSERNPA